ncbi:DUF7009 family protein [Chitinophaga alhagiae]|uniref:DUF7009 family protein n=1 Tax=Chitinophaga alhagiae TaxID=2203219 RepID=UPI000E5C3DC3|nr:hypothetical protein [Chitinophaga alhagiae]
MKIRIRGNSIRYRLDKADIAVLEARGKVEEHTRIGAHSLHFCVRSKEGLQAPAIQLEGPAVHLAVPATQIQAWTGTDLTGFDAVIINPDGSELKILVEKDFKCLTERGEDESQAFDNPLSSHTC